jgi:histidine triad (HIT) family protein
MALDRLTDMPYTRDDCLFCKIVTGRVPADEVHRDDHVVAFRDIHPQAPVHVLLVPTNHYDNAAEVAADDPHALAALVLTAKAVAQAEGIGESGYRLLSNTGTGAGQTVFHAHLHLLGGSKLSERG